MAPVSSGGDLQDSMDETSLRARLAELGFMAHCRRAAGDVVQVLLDLSESFEAPDETLLLREGDVRGTEGFILLEGSVTVIKAERGPVRVQAPALLGEMQQFSISGSRSASVLTEGQCTLLRFSWPTFYSTLQDRLRPLDFQQVKDAIRRHSWNHALDDDED